MARVPPDEMIRLERDISLERLATARGVNLTKSGAALTGTCPFHPSSKRPPTITIGPKSNTWACSKCSVTDGTVVLWTMKAEGISRSHALELLRADHGVGGGKVVKSSTVTKLPDVTANAADDTVLLGQVAAYYADALTRNV
ncbi:MAG TPA: CHC2 zinc finger domain-containing protein, partial [Acidothermaceae bacterium]